MILVGLLCLVVHTQLHTRERLSNYIAPKSYSTFHYLEVEDEHQTSNEFMLASSFSFTCSACFLRLESLYPCNHKENSCSEMILAYRSCEKSESDTKRLEQSCVDKTIHSIERKQSHHSPDLSSSSINQTTKSKQSTRRLTFMTSLWRCENSTGRYPKETRLLVGWTFNQQQPQHCIHS